LTKEKLEELKQRINEHFKNELILMRDMINAHLTKEEIRELKAYMASHPFCSVSQLIQKKARTVVLRNL
jgi:ElaB/YqjD/DUF883 family membrane-anchored ribosome-binding protein